MNRSGSGIGTVPDMPSTLSYQPSQKQIHNIDLADANARGLAAASGLGAQPDRLDSFFYADHTLGPDVLDRFDHFDEFIDKDHDVAQYSDSDHSNDGM